MARAEGVRQQRRTLHDGEVVVTIFEIEKLYWDHTRGLQQLQGMPVSEMLGPNYLILDAACGDAASPRPHLRGVKVAVLHKVPKTMKLLELFSELRKLRPA